MLVYTLFEYTYAKVHRDPHVVGQKEKMSYERRPMH